MLHVAGFHRRWREIGLDIKTNCGTHIAIIKIAKYLCYSGAQGKYYSEIGKIVRFSLKINLWVYFFKSSGAHGSGLAAGVLLVSRTSALRLRACANDLMTGHRYTVK